MISNAKRELRMYLLSVLEILEVKNALGTLCKNCMQLKLFSQAYEKSMLRRKVQKKKSCNHFVHLTNDQS